MSFVVAIILGIIEGVTEFLPISSTAHLDLASHFLRLTETDFVKAFIVIIQCGAILAVLVVYFSVLKKNINIWKRIIVAFIPTAIIGFAVYKIIKNYFFGNILLMIFTLGIGGVILIVFEYLYAGRKEGDDALHELESLSYKKSLIIGLAQALAVVPGVSRSAATIVAGKMLGLSRKAIVDFSFLLAVPTMIAASGYDLLKNIEAFSPDDMWSLAVGFIAAFIAAYYSVRWLLAFVKLHGFAVFGYYRIVLALVLVYIYLIA